LSAASLAASASRQEDLQSLRQRIDALSKDLEKQEGTRREARDALKSSERAISEANRTLAGLQAEQRALRTESNRIAERRRALERTAAERQGAIARMLAAHYLSSAPDALRVALSGEDPASAARTLHYVGYVSRAATRMLADYRQGIADQVRLAEEARQRADRLREVEQAERSDRDKVLAERRERRRTFERIGADVRKSRREIKVLQADAARLARLVERIGQVIQGRVDRVPEKGGRKLPFSTLRGKLAFPVTGELTGRFGAPRRGTEGAALEAKGVFIRAPEGQPVRAIAHGQVVYADWMRGFGNLLILDHGDAYLSIYANNESLLKQVGDTVATGEPVATTGASGGNEETGLYFELRHLGRAFDPLRWVKLK
jgi:murein hydrolase activator